MTPKEFIRQKFDLETAKKFDEHEVRSALTSLNIEGKEPGPELLAELMAFSFQENNPNSDGHRFYFGSMMTWRAEDGTVTEYPSVEKVTPEMINYWTDRAKESINPILVTRYSGLVWELQNKVTGSRPPIELCRLNIQSILRQVEGNYCKREVYCLKKLERALTLSIEINEASFVEACKNAIIQTENEYSQDNLPGLWGYSFDLLMDNKKVSLSGKEEAEIINELENKLERLTNPPENNKIDPWAAETAAKRLATYYRKQRKEEEVRRVIIKIGKAFSDIESDGSAMQVSGWLEQVRNLYLEYNLKEEAEQLLKRIREIGPKVAAELQPISHSVEIPKGKLDKYIEEILSGTSEEVMIRIVVAYMPKKEEVKEQIFALSKTAPLIYLMAHQIQDERGRTIATIGSLENDLEGHIVRQISQNLSFSQLFLRRVVSEAFKRGKIGTEVILEFIRKSPVISVERLVIIEKAIRAYFDEDHIVFAHLLIPQIEDALRNLVELSGGNVLKTSRNGGYQLRTLDDLLRDQIMNEVLGEDWATYFRILLTDQRGWNLRNKVCHGLIESNQFSYEITDRLLHVLLSLGLLKENPSN